jgi:hypothetical protein
MQVVGWKTWAMFDRYHIVTQADLDVFRGRMEAYVHLREEAAGEARIAKELLQSPVGSGESVQAVAMMVLEVGVERKESAENNGVIDSKEGEKR